MRNHKSILVIRHGALGDFVFCIGAMQSIRKQNPLARITLITQGSLVPLATVIGCFDHIEVDDRRGYSPWSLWRICKRIIVDGEFDVVYDFQSSHRTLCIYYWIVNFLTAAPVKWIFLSAEGFQARKTPGKRRFMIRWPSCEPAHLGPIGDPDFSSCECTPELAGQLPRQFALLIPGCSARNARKRWPSNNYRQISEFLGTHGIMSVIIGTVEEAMVIAEITRANRYTLDLSGKTGVLDVVGIARRARLVIGNDTGPTHLAKFSGPPTIVLLGNENRHVACHRGNVRSLIAAEVQDIEVGDVISTIKELMA